MIMHQYQYVVQTDRLDYGKIGACIRKGLCISMTLRGDNNGVRTEMTSALLELVRKMMNVILRQYEMKNIIDELSSTGNLNKVVIHSLFTCYFVNTPLMLNGGSIPFLHPAFELCKNN